MMFSLLFELMPSAFPALVDQKPVGLSSPVLITGDSDSTTSTQMATYLDYLAGAPAGVTVLVREDWAQRLAGESPLDNAPSVGVHPFGEQGRTYRESFAEICQQIKIARGSPATAVRGHHFQYAGRTSVLDCCRANAVAFDLNCVAANGQLWGGSASGVGFPMRYPPLAGRYEKLPLHLPTVVEDDVFLFSHDYCYRPTRESPAGATDAVISILDSWVLENHCPACLNLHPEHVEPSNSHVLAAVIQWCRQNSIWAPSLDEYSDFVRRRETAIISVLSNGSAQLQGADDLSLTTPSCVHLRSALANSNGENKQ
jgi:hypothetical protein